MSDAVLRSTQGRIGILTVNNPPVNALAAAVRDGIKEGVEAFGADPNIDAIVLIGGGRTFIAGADIREFGKPPSGANLNDVIATHGELPQDRRRRAARHAARRRPGDGAGRALSRRRCPSTRVGLPEVHLGILPGAGGTQRLPRLTGAKYALDAIISGRHIPAPEAKSKGIIDAIVEGDDLLAGAVAHAQMLVAQKAPRRRVRDLNGDARIARPVRGDREGDRPPRARLQGAVEHHQVRAGRRRAAVRRGHEARARAVRRAADLVGVGGAALLLLRRARGRQGARRAGRHAAAHDQDRRHHRRRHDGRRHRHELRQCRHSRDACSRSSRRRSTAASRPSAPTTRTPPSAAA